MRPKISHLHSKQWWSNKICTSSLEITMDIPHVDIFIKNIPATSQGIWRTKVWQLWATYCLDRDGQFDFGSELGFHLDMNRRLIQFVKDRNWHRFYNIFWWSGYFCVYISLIHYLHSFSCENLNNQYCSKDNQKAFFWYTIDLSQLWFWIRI